MKLKKKIVIPVCIAAVVILLLTAFSLCYFVYRIPLFDRSGWHVTRDGVTQYWDYYGKPMVHWQNIDGQQYYFDPDSGAVAIGWLVVEEKKYYFDLSGVLQTQTG